LTLIPKNKENKRKITEVATSEEEQEIGEETAMCESDSEESNEEEHQYFTSYGYRTRDRLTMLNTKQINRIGKHIAKSKEVKRYNNTRKHRSQK